MEKKLKNIFVEGPIDPTFVADSIRKHSEKTAIGGHSIFLGQVRADIIENKPVTGISFTAYEQMALEKMHAIREEIFQEYPITCMHVYQSLGYVPTGALCLFVFTSAPHRKAAIDACEVVVERLKTEVPIWGKELFDDDSWQWKKPALTP